MAPLHCHHWHELSENERRAIDDSHDYSIISVIDGLDNKERNIIYRCISFDLNKGKEYNTLQTLWLEKEKEYLALNTGKDPKDISDEELIEDEKKWGNFCRYRLYYAGKKYLEGKFDAFKVNLNNAPTESLELMTDFFEDIRNAYDYNPFDNIAA